MVRNLGPEGTDRSDVVDITESTVMPADPHAVPVRPAVSVLLIRDGAAGLEVFVQHRVATMDFAAGVVVYPGGRVDPVDETTGASLATAPEVVDAHEQAWHLSACAELPGGARTLMACAMREVAEEAGVVLAAEDLKPWANWVTPPGRSRRFDTYFFVTAPEDADAAVHQTTEAENSEWMNVRHIIAEEEAQRLKLMRPTLALLGEIDALGSVKAVMGSDHEIVPVKPREPGKHS